MTTLTNRPIKRQLYNALYHSECHYCGEAPEWVLDPDPDGPSWTGTCGCEGGTYWMTVDRVRMEWLEDAE